MVLIIVPEHKTFKQSHGSGLRILTAKSGMAPDQVNARVPVVEAVGVW